MDFEALHSANFKLLDDTVADWTSMIVKLAELEKAACEGLNGQARKADWAGYNAAVSREFIGKTAGEFNDAHTQATSIRNIMRDTRDELKTQQRLLKEAAERGRGNHLTVLAKGGGFTVEANPDSTSPGNQQETNALRDELQGILDRATEIDDSATQALKALVDLTDYGFSEQAYKDRDSADTALKTADELAALAKKDVKQLSVKEFDALLAGLRKHSGDALFAERFALKLGASGTLDFWADINETRLTPTLSREREDHFDDLQKQLSLTLANATQSDTVGMADWKRQVVDLGDKWVGRGDSGPMGFQVMSNLMRWGDYDDEFLKSYGSSLIATEKKLGDTATMFRKSGRHPPSWKRT